MSIIPGASVWIVPASGAGSTECMRQAALILLALAGLLTSCGGSPKASRPLVLVHVMPWFESKERSGAWGWHWTMDRKDPSKGEVAAHQRPLIGPYDSSDPVVVAHQVALMKAAGVDGVIIDWYGPGGFQDYDSIHRASMLLVAEVKKAGLKFVVCMEDSIGTRFMNERRLSREDATAKVAEAFDWLDRNWLRDPSCLRLQGRPALMIFGPQFLTAPEWTAIRTRVTSSPVIFALPHLDFRGGSGWGLDGRFQWIPVSEGRTVPPETWKTELLTTRKEGFIAVAFPGYHDFYAEAAVRPSYGRIDARNGATFAESLDLALSSGAPVVQIATWNDYGEGTAIEPSVEGGHRDLATLMSRLRPGADMHELERITEAFLRSRDR